MADDGSDIRPTSRARKFFSQQLLLIKECVMSSKLRGSEQLNMECCGVAPLTREEIEQVAGGSIASWYTVFLIGIPWPELFNTQLPSVNPAGRRGGGAGGGGEPRT